jgi:MarR family transcriptional regulator for hemolysin
MESLNISLLEMGKMMHEVYRVFKKLSDELTPVEVKISSEQFSLLHAISIKEDDVIQKDMAEMMGKDKSAILRLIDSLEEKELVRRVVDLKDRRKNYLMVTKLGYRVIDQYMKVVDDLIVNLQQGLTQSEIDVFHKVVNHLESKAKKL